MNGSFPRDKLEALPSAFESSTGESLEVEKVLNHRVDSKGTYQYLVHWKGETPDMATWESEVQFDSLQPIDDYWRFKQREM